MAKVPSLKSITTLASSHVLLDFVEETNTRYSEYILTLLEDGVCSSVAEDILYCLLTLYTEKVTDRILKAVAPSHLTELKVEKRLPQLTFFGLTEVMKKCKHLKQVSLKECDQLMSPGQFILWRRLGVGITALCLESCHNVTDQVVQSALRHIPTLKHLNISSCESITETVFLLNEDQQKEVEFTPWLVKSQHYECSLVSVDVSGCPGITSTAVRHLASLTGPTLKNVNLSWTSINLIAILSLAGYSLPAMIELVISFYNKVNGEKDPKNDELYHCLLEFKHTLDKVEKKQELDGKAHNRINEHSESKVVSAHIPVQNLQKLDLNHAAKQESNINTVKSKVFNDIFSVKAGTSTGLESTDELLVAQSNDGAELVHNRNGTDGQLVHLDNVTLDFVDPSYECSSNDSGNEASLISTACLVKPEEEIEKEKELCISKENLVECDSLNDNHVSCSIPSHNLSNSSNISCENGALTETSSLDCLHSNYVMGHGSTKDTVECSCDLSAKETTDISTTSPGNENFSYQHDQVSCGLEDVPNVCCDNTYVQQQSDDNIHVTTDLENKKSQNTDTNSEKLLYCANNTETLLPKSECVMESQCQMGPLSDPDYQMAPLSDPNCQHCKENQCQDMRPLTNCQSIHNNNVCASISDRTADSDSSAASISDRTADSDSGAAKENVNADSENLHESLSGLGSENLNQNTNLNTESEDTVSTGNTLEMDDEGNNLPEMEDEGNNLPDVEDEGINLLETEDKGNNNLEMEVKENNLLESEGEGNSHLVVNRDRIIQTYKPQLVSVDVTNKFSSVYESVGFDCLKEFLQCVPNLHKFGMSWAGLTDDMVKDLTPYFMELREINLNDCESVTYGITHIGQTCKNLTKVDFNGIHFIKDIYLRPFLQNEDLRCLYLAESDISDGTLFRLASRKMDDFEELDLSWCDEVTVQGLNALCRKPSTIQKLSFRHCPASTLTLALMAENFKQLQCLNICSVDSITDSSVVYLVENLPLLREIDISWNSGLTDTCVKALLRSCIHLKKAVLSGMKFLTSAPFLPIISDLQKFRRSQALLRLKLHERNVLHDNAEDHYSSDEEFEELHVPHRSTTYAANLQVLELEYCDCVDDNHLAEIVAVCRGSLFIVDYFREAIKPVMIHAKKGKVFLPPQAMMY